MTHEQASKRTYIIMLLVPLFWGASFPLAKHVTTEIPPLTAATLRFGLAGIILIVITSLRTQVKWRQVKRQLKSLLAMSIVGIFGYNALFFFALTKTSAINGSLIIATTPVFLALGAILFFGERQNKNLLISLPLSLIGVLLVISKGSPMMLIQLDVNYGDLLFIGALACWTSHGLFGKAIMEDVSPLVTTTFTTVVGSLFLFIFAAVFENSWSLILHMSLQAWIEMIFMVIFSSVIAFFLWNDGIHKIGASISGMYLNLNPVNTALISVVLYGSYITGVQIFGMILVLMS